MLVQNIFPDKCGLRTLPSSVDPLYRGTFSTSDPDSGAAPTSVIFLLFGVPKIFGASAKNQSFFVPFRWFSPPQADFFVSFEYFPYISIYFKWILMQ